MTTFGLENETCIVTDPAAFVTLQIPPIILAVGDLMIHGTLNLYHYAR